MSENLIADATQLRSSAQDHRRKGREQLDRNRARSTEEFDAAVAEFRKAITMLERGLRILRRTEPGHTPDICRILEALSQTYGSLGGTYRDARELTQARDSYDRGNEYEEERRRHCAAKDTYNLFQRLIVRLLINPSLVADEAFRTDLAQVRQEIERQIRAGRNDSWALADLALVQILSGEEADAVIADIEKGQADVAFFESTYNAVAALLREGLGEDHGLGQRMETFKRLLQRRGGLT